MPAQAGVCPLKAVQISSRDELSRWRKDNCFQNSLLCCWGRCSL